MNCGSPHIALVQDREMTDEGRTADLVEMSHRTRAVATDAGVVSGS